METSLISLIKKTFSLYIHMYAKTLELEIPIQPMRSGVTCMLNIC